MKVKAKTKHVRRICQLLFALLVFLAICDGCQPSFGFGASAAVIKTEECSIDAHCGPGQYCFQHTGKCAACSGEQLCKKYGRQLKSSVATHGCVKSVADCGSCLPNYREDSDYCYQMIIPETYSQEANKSGFSEKGDFTDIVNSPTVPWVGIGAAIIIVPAVAVCLVYMSKSIRKRASREIAAGDLNESYPMVPLKPHERGNNTAEPQVDPLIQNISEVHQASPPEEYLPPPPYAPPIEVHTPPAEPRREQVNDSNQQAVPFNMGLFGAQNQAVAENIVNNMQEHINDGGMEQEENQLPPANDPIDIPEELLEGLGEIFNEFAPDAEPTGSTAASTPTHNANFSDSGHSNSFDINVQVGVRLNRNGTPTFTFDHSATYLNLSDFMSGNATYQFSHEETSNDSQEAGNDRFDRVVPEFGATEEEDEGLLMEEEAPTVTETLDNIADYWGEDD